MSYILVIGANPAWEKVLEFNKFTAGEVNRASRVDGYAAGKATNFCRALKCLGGLPGRQLTFLGGETGRRFADALTAEGLECLSVPTGQETRTCTNCVCRGEMTELVEPGTSITLDMQEQFLALLHENLANAAGIAVAGSIPDRSTPDFMGKIAEAANEANLPMLVDNYQNAPEALAVKPDLFLKINALELQKLTGQPAIEEGLAWFHAHYPLATSAITDGPKQAHLLLPQECRSTELPVPAVEAVNPLGAGDTCSAVFFARLLAGCAPQEAFSDALAAASASCLTNQAGNFDPAAMEVLKNMM
ncbi:MAG: hypothetical protein IKS83_04140 [Victivallales bacterium]|nr:hypothetical protein [Victivallales bacterium]